MDGLPRGERVLPPCDRCRRLRMDCIKNLTSCAGCTRKHARCHWREVSRDELGALDHLMDTSYPESGYSPSNANGYANGNPDIDDESDDDDSNPLEDLEALGDIEEQENQIREDEEGLRNARELARQGWQGSNPTEANLELTNGIAEHPMAHQPDSEGTTGATAESGKMDQDKQLPATLSSQETTEKDSPIQDVPQPPEQNDSKPAIHAGFQAVNGMMHLSTSE